LKREFISLQSMRLMLVTDAWRPQTNGVVNTLEHTCRQLTAMGVVVERISPEMFSTVPCPSYPDIRLAFGAGADVRRALDAFRPDAIHIATEGPLGVAARAHCRRRHWRFTTSYHTQFPEYVRARWPIPLAVAYRYMRWFHDAAARTMVATPMMERLLLDRGFRNLRAWSRGVDTELFRPVAADPHRREPRLIYVGRISVEKNIEAFLATPLPGHKIVVGDGPARAVLEKKYPQAEFTGMLYGGELASKIAAADVMVFPSRTDTFGLVMLEAMACGVPVAAFPVTGPLDVITQGVTGWMSENLIEAVERALRLDRSACRRAVEARSWQSASLQFLGNLVAANALSALPSRSWSTRRADPAL
jgi:glycosyltransferase involved in cell wall biosynthesis